MSRIILVLTLTIFLSGCGILSFFTNDDVETDVVVHPELPRPVQNQNTDWIIIEDDEAIFVAAPYQQFLNHLESEEDKLRYIRQINKTVCFYRTELEEEFCQTIKDKNKK